MKIAKIEAIPVSYPEPNDFNALRYLCLAKITADDGQVGWERSSPNSPRRISRSRRSSTAWRPI